MSVFNRVVFTKRDYELVKLISSIPNLSAFFSQETKQRMLLFKELSGSFLQFSASAFPPDGPYFTKGPETINLNIRDGGFF